MTGNVIVRFMYRLYVQINYGSIMNVGVRYFCQPIFALFHKLLDHSSENFDAQQAQEGNHQRNPVDSGPESSIQNIFRVKQEVRTADDKYAETPFKNRRDHAQSVIKDIFPEGVFRHKSCRHIAHICYSQT